MTARPAPLPRLTYVMAALALLALVPFLFARLPSMVDLPGHIGRYAVMLDGGRSADLARYYVFDWRLVGNLGADLIVYALGWLGAERAAWVASALIAPLTILGMAAVSRALHGRIQPGAVAAACFAMANPLMFGFVNYCLSFALALLTFALWIRLRDGPAWRALPLLALAAFGTWLAHAMGWGVLGLLAGGFELERLARRRAPAALGEALLRGLALTPPILLTLAWRSEGGALLEWGNDILTRKAMNWVVVLRGEAKWIDLATPVLLALACLLAWRRQAIDWRLATGAGLIALACCVMPTTLFGSWGADERIAPAAVIAALLSLRWRPFFRYPGLEPGSRCLAPSSEEKARPRIKSGVTVVGTDRIAIAFVALAVALFATRTALIARDWHRHDAAYAAHLAALDQAPMSARLHAIVLQDDCHTAWQATAYNHLPSLAIGRRHALVNSEWLLPGAALLKVRQPGDPKLLHDPSQLVTGFDCSGPVTKPLVDRLNRLRGTDWQYLWLLNTRGTDRLPGTAPLYRDANSALYRLPG